MDSETPAKNRDRFRRTKTIKKLNIKRMRTKMKNKACEKL
jgi:hypothetical protein